MTLVDRLVVVLEHVKLLEFYLEIVVSNFRINQNRFDKQLAFDQWFHKRVFGGYQRLDQDHRERSDTMMIKIADIFEEER
jgi:hypothetical protein